MICDSSNTEETLTKSAFAFSKMSWDKSLSDRGVTLWSKRVGIWKGNRDLSFLLTPRKALLLQQRMKASTMWRIGTQENPVEYFTPEPELRDQFLVSDILLDFSNVTAVLYVPSLLGYVYHSHSRYEIFLTLRKLQILSCESKVSKTNHQLFAVSCIIRCWYQNNMVIPAYFRESCMQHAAACSSMPS